MIAYLSVLAENLLPVLAAAVGIVLTLLVRKAVEVFEKNTKISITSEQESQLERLVMLGVAAAEEWARKQLPTEEKPSGAEKLDYALKFIEAELERLGLVAVAREQLAKRLEALLGMSRPTP